MELKTRHILKALLNCVKVILLVLCTVQVCNVVFSINDVASNISFFNQCFNITVVNFL